MKFDLHFLIENKIYNYYNYKDVYSQYLIQPVSWYTVKNQYWLCYAMQINGIIILIRILIHQETVNNLVETN